MSGYDSDAGRASTVSRLPRSLIVYVAASSIYAALVFLAVHATYGIELGRSGVRLPDPEALLTSIDSVSFAIWLGLSLIAGIVLHRMATALSRAQNEQAQRQSEIGSIFALGQALSGSLALDAIAQRFLETASGSLGPSVTSSLYAQDDRSGSFRLVLERGPHLGLWGPRYSISDVPAPIRTRVVDHQQPLVLPDVLASGVWGLIATALTNTSWVRSFAAMPLVSHDRLVGVAIFTSDTTNAITADGIQLVALVSQFVASAIRTSLTFAEAERRADREAIVSRVAQRARASLDPDEVLRSTVQELGRSLEVRRAVAALGASAEELRVAQEWTAPGITPLGIGSTDLHISRLAATSGRTAQSTSEASRLATPIVIAGELAGVLAVHDDPAREWSVDDVRLLEMVAREVRGAMEAARLFEGRQRENERLLALQRASAVVATRTTTREVIDEVLGTASALLGQAGAALYLWDDDARVLRLVQSAGASGRPASGELSDSPGMSGDILAKLEPVIVNDYGTWPGASPNGKATGITAVLAVPLIRGAKLVGAIVLRAYDTQTRFTIDDAHLLGLFGDQAVAALTNIEAFERQRGAMEQLERVNRAKSEFVSIVSHEFRTPLTGIQGFSEMMRDEDLTIPEMKEYAADINKDAMRLTRMVNEMLDLDRMESGRMTLHREPTDLNAIVTEAVGRLRPNAPNHRITVAIDPSLPHFAGDRDRVMQVVGNLLSNAVKYSPTGGEIAVATVREGLNLHLSVADQGMGIPADKLESIWERYSRVDSDGTRGIQGTGLGLPIVQQIVVLHGGRAWAESELGRGSIFHVLLPIAASSQAVEA